MKALQNKTLANAMFISHKHEASINQTTMVCPRMFFKQALKPTKGYVRTKDTLVKV